MSTDGIYDDLATRLVKRMGGRIVGEQGYQYARLAMRRIIDRNPHPNAPPGRFMEDAPSLARRIKGSEAEHLEGILQREYEQYLQELPPEPDPVPQELQQATAEQLVDQHALSKIEEAKRDSASRTDEDIPF